MNLDLSKYHYEFNVFFNKIGAREVLIGNWQSGNYRYHKNYYIEGDGFYRLTYINSFRSFVVEFAETFDEAINCHYEDGNLYTIEMSPEKMVEEFRKTLEVI